MSEAYEAGLERGWDHANYVKAYGVGHDRRTPDYPGWLSLNDNQGAYGTNTSAERHAARAEFSVGWSDGRKRFARGQYPDGSKIDGSE